MKLWFLNRGYPKWFTDTEVEKVKFSCTSRKRDTKVKGIPLVIAYHPLLKDFASVIRKHLYILYLNKEVKEIFTPGPMVSFRRARKLGSYLVRAILLNKYKMNDRNFLKGQTCMQQHLFEHFASEGHCSFLEDVSITFIDKTDPKDPNQREHYWRHTLKTMAPLGLNIEDD